MTASVPITVPGNNDLPTNVHFRVFLFDQAPAPTCSTLAVPPFFDCSPAAAPVSTCGLPGQGEFLVDQATIRLELSGFSCGSPSGLPNRHSLRVYVCHGASFGCQKTAAVDVSFTAGDLSQALCEQPPPPPQDDCDDCLSCPTGGSTGPGASGGGGAAPGKSGGGAGGGGFRVTGRGVSITPEASGPGALLRYFGGGVGHPGFPGTALHAPALGRYWSHDFAERLVTDPSDPDKVWLLTRVGNFRSFADADQDGTYEDATPTNEYRKLVETASGYELRYLDGTTAFFSLDGRWLRSDDRNGNALMATYDGAQLVSVSFADGRREDLAYHPTGKLASITEVGVAGALPRAWSYTWSGDDLVRIDRPDGTAWVFEYGAPGLPGYLTAMKLRSTLGAERLERAWEYDASGNVRSTWRGDASRTGPNATEAWELQYDNPQRPATVTVIDPLGDPTVYTLDRTDPARPRIARIDGTCPGCGLGGTTVFSYGDPGHPLRPTEMVDGEGNRTIYSYDGNGMRTSVTEAVGTPEQRMTLWDYDPNFPAFMTRQEQIGVQAGVPRVTSWVYDPDRGDLESTTIEGYEATFAAGPQFGLTTTYANHPDSGALEEADPPGYGTADRTSFTYDPALGSLVPLTRTDPLIGTTSFEHDARNRRTATIDPNGTRTETSYDALDRVRFTRLCNVATPSTSCGPTETLVTEHQYDTFGDLVSTILPRGNVIEYGYDGVGRLVRMERRPVAGTNGERTLFTLDAAGSRTLERLERWDGVAWVLDAQTETVYETRCQVRKTVLGKGSPSESVTELEYDCNGNLEKTWDANHPRLVPSTPATSEHAYDALDRLVQTTQPWGGPGGGVVTTGYQYDAQDHLTRVIDGEGGTTRYEYSDRDLLTREISEVSGTTTHRYNEHGEIDRTTDARSIVTNRTVDAFDRLLQVTYPDAARNVTYTYDDALVPYSLGRLTRVVRGRTGVDYRYDGFGRTVRDGALAYGLDANGNRATVSYPGDAVAAYTYDFADRPASVALSWPEGGGTSMATVANGARYAAFGPLQRLTLGNGLVEERSHDPRYFSDRIRVLAAGTPVFDWDYTVDSVGNPTRIDDLGGAGSLRQPAVARIYGYQDVQYYLTRGDGPWGTLDWSYDRIGNRLSEQRSGGAPEAYDYRSNAVGGNTAVLETIDVNRVYTFGAAGHLEQVNAAGNVIAFDHDDEGRLGSVARQFGESVTADYDGRGFLAEIGGLGSSGIFGDRFESGDGSCWDAVVGGTVGSGPCGPQRTEGTEATYSSEGVLHHLRQRALDSRRDRYVVMFGARPLALLTLDASGGELQYLTTDHLGTPALATSEAGLVDWQGGFEPFGRDWLQGTSGGSSEQGVFLRLLGQWADEVWGDASLGAQITQNGLRWNEPGTGRYVMPDPLGLSEGPNLLAYVESRPLTFADPLGLQLAVPPDVPPVITTPPPAGCSPASQWRFLGYDLQLGQKSLRWVPVRVFRNFRTIGIPGFGGGRMPAPKGLRLPIPVIDCYCVYKPAGLFAPVQRYVRYHRLLDCGSCGDEQTTSLELDVWTVQLPSIGPPSLPSRVLKAPGCYCLPFDEAFP